LRGKAKASQHGHRQGPGRRHLIAAVAIAAFISCPGLAFASQVLVLEAHGRVAVRSDPPVRLATWSAGAEAAGAEAAFGSSRAIADASMAERNVRTELRRLYRTHEIPQTQYLQYLNSFNSALQAVKRLTGTRANELEAVIHDLHEIAANGALTPSRLPVLFQTLARNREWWTTGPLPAPRQIVGFAGSEIDWEYYPGQGLEVQPLASFGKADWFFTHGAGYYQRGSNLLAELIALAARRAGGLAWEYYFGFDGGAPPWTSAMSQGTALQALADGYTATKDSSYLEAAKSALPVFRSAPPSGVAVRTPRGLRFVQYTFAPARSEEIINAFLQTLIGLGDYASVSGDPSAAQLFEAGNTEAEFEVPSYDTGAWSLYQPGLEDDLSYHELVTGFLAQLCSMTNASAYCAAATHFRRYLHTPPALKLLTERLKVRSRRAMWFRVSKASRVGITVSHNGRTVFLTSANFSHGVHGFEVPPLATAGRYDVRLDATDLAGNYNEIIGAVRLTR
jgi:hypothetical protein